MKNMNLGMLAVSAAFVVLANPAQALPVTVGGSIAANTLLTAGARAGSFDLSAVLQPNSQIGSASYSFSFADNIDVLTVGARVLAYGPVLSNAVLTSSSGGGNTDVSRWLSNTSTSVYTQTNSRAGEGAAVTLGSASIAAGSGATATTTSTQSSGPTWLRVTYDTKVRLGYWSPSPCANPFYTGCGSYIPGEYNYFTTANYVVDNVTLNDQTGTFTVSGSITDAGLLAEMNTNRSLSFSLGIWGDLLLSSATLTLDIGINNAVSAVPEPGTLALAGAGLAMALAVSRRRRQHGAGR